MKQFIAFPKQLGKRADYLLHRVIAGDIALLVFTVLAYVLLAVCLAL